MTDVIYQLIILTGFYVVVDYNQNYNHEID
jgi:hypothetical protein